MRSDANATTAASAGTPNTPRPARMTWPPTLPFSHVLQRAKTLDQQALSLLYTRFLPVVYRFTLAHSGDARLAEDLTADTFYAMLEGIQNVRAEDELGFAAWLLSVARRLVAQHFRRRPAPTAPLADLTEDAHPTSAADEGDPLAIITARESWSDAVRALNRLTEDQRSVILYRCILGYTTEEVATLLDKQPGAVRALQFRALDTLAHLLGGHSAAQPARHERRGQR